ncbi:hypothetical protein [Actinoallomurus rhizosphaericola]|uniref:hypothetical protein n=1 Tax=Actinoallomurus rhizosphaericola TaxID=2952536 RepID=UPI002093223F|nr:hypothetical protein [Actinoallomurus rhizosphaericola]MCO5998094.1 hypothetical protein [Actinoallomurus rhizosphaericola]
MNDAKPTGQAGTGQAGAGLDGARPTGAPVAGQAGAGLDGLDGDTLWTAVLAAAAGSRAGPAASVARLCEGGGSTRLGWVRPPGRHLVEQNLTEIQAALAVPEGRPVVLLGTGGWTFAVQALREVLGPDSGVVPMDSLCPAAIRATLNDAGPPGAYVAVSASRSTMEAVRLAECVPAFAGAEGGRLVWLSDQATPPSAFALSPRHLRDQTAIIGAPLSTAFLLPAAIMAGARLAAVYTGFVRRYRLLGLRAAREAVEAPADGAPDIHIVAPRWAGPGLRLWLLQLGRQALCGKSDRFRPAIAVVGPDEDAPATVRLDLSAAEPGLAGLVDTMYLAGAFAACLALRAGVPVAEECNVHAYKDLLRGPATPEAGSRAPTARALPDAAADWLADRPELTRLHVVRYDSAAELPDAVRVRFAAVTRRPCEVHDGSAWNHHSFQAVYADRSAAVLVLAPPEPAGDLPLAEAARAQHRIAVATHRSLADRSRLIRVQREEDRCEGDRRG